ncbi:MAG TPA: mannitol dehydrogenase family protein, partial [Rubellimicrobium sp.]|nr:mannitol dehydrogenase family protein [Rubellimicrobium sp.]
MPIQLNADALSHLPEGVAGPAYDRAGLRAGILHVGVGNFHRAHMQVYLDRLFGMGRDHDFAIRGAGVRPTDAAMRDRLAAQDFLTTVVELDPSGLSARVIGSMIDFVPVEPEAVIAAMADPAIRIVSTTVTEGGYYVDAKTDGFAADHPDIQADVANPDAPKTVFGMVLAALRRRRDAGVPPFTFLSCDNLPENGHVAERTVTGLARLQDPAFADWVAANVAFPNSMVDCITPATSDRERRMVADKFGLTDSAPVACEPFRQWVLEDNFPQGRPALEEVGAEFVANVAQYELMKLRILNGGHAAIAYPGALLGHHTPLAVRGGRRDAVHHGVGKRNVGGHPVREGGFLEAGEARYRALRDVPVFGEVIARQHREGRHTGGAPAAQRGKDDPEHRL